MVVTTATRADAQEAPGLIQNYSAKGLIADQSYNSEEVVALAQRLGMEVVIPPRQHRKHPRAYDRYLYGLRNAFWLLKQWRSRHPLSEASLFVSCRWANPLPHFLAQNLMTIDSNHFLPN